MDLTDETKELIREEVYEYLKNEPIRFSEEYTENIQSSIEDYFMYIKQVLEDEHSTLESLEISNAAMTMQAMYLLVSCCLEEILPRVYLKPEWLRSEGWEEFIKKAKKGK
tara:strand:- start:2491 stop:2820 length:330 start_codon:yes stop_codon:yes gene_type:complete